MTQTASKIVATLPAKAGGNSQYVTVEYPGMLTTLSINVRYGPPAPFQNNSVGFNAYTGDGRRILAGGEGGRTATTVDVYAELNQESPETLLVQVVNYEPFDIDYTLDVNGAAGSVLAATENAAPERAYLLTAQNTAMRGTLPAGPEGTYQFYLLNYPGGQREVKIGISADNVGGSYGENVLGLALFAGAEPAGFVNAHLNEWATKRVGYITIKQDDAQTFGIQVFNWTKGLPVGYTIYTTGL